MTPTVHIAGEKHAGYHQLCTICGETVCSLGVGFKVGAHVVQTGPRSFSDAALYQITKAPWGETVRCQPK